MSDTDAPELTAAGSGKSEAEVAFELLSKLKGQGVWGERNVSAILDMYAECLDAAKGLRAYEGQKRVDVPILGPKVEPTLRTAPPQTPINLEPAPLPRQAPPGQPPVQAQPRQQPAPTQAQQTVHAQQQVLAQAYKSV